MGSLKQFNKKVNFADYKVQKETEAISQKNN